MPWLFPILAYLVGSIPFGVLLARSRGIDIRAHGSGNVGATNVFRVVGRNFGIACLILDFLKGFVPVALATNLLRITGASPAIPIPFFWDFTTELAPDQQLHLHSGWSATRSRRSTRSAPTHTSAACKSSSGWIPTLRTAAAYPTTRRSRRRSWRSSSLPTPRRRPRTARSLCNRTDNDSNLT